MENLKPESAELAGTRRRSERTFQLGPQEETEERRELMRKFRRERLREKLKELAAIVVFVAASYALLKKNTVHHWLDEFLSRPSPPWLSLLLAVPALLPLLFLPWLAIFKLKESDERSQAWRFTVYWALLLLGISLMVWLGKLPPDCDVRDCGGTP